MTPSSVALFEGLERAHWTPLELWRAALGTGGAFNRHDIEALLNGSRRATQVEHDILASVFNDDCIERHDDHPVRYWRELRP